MSICPHCGNHCPTPRHSEKLRNLFAARVGMPATLHRPSADAGHNEFATAIFAAEDVIDPHAAPLVVLGQGDTKVLVDLPKPDYTGMQGFFRDLGRAMGYGNGGGQ